MGRGAGGAALSPALGDLLAGDVVTAAAGLLGCLLTASGVTVRVVETEAYDGIGVDPASHAHRGPTRRNAPMFGPPGTAYAYFVYGMHWCLNVTCGPEGRPAAVLLRAGAVVDGLDLARMRAGARPGVADHELARGPARLTRVLALDGAVGGTDLLAGDGPAVLGPPARPIGSTAVRSGPRVGVVAAHDVPWRFWIDGERAVSAYRRHVPRRASIRARDGAGSDA